jgi:hypothetical protein
VTSVERPRTARDSFEVGVSSSPEALIGEVKEIDPDVEHSAACSTAKLPAIVKQMVKDRYVSVAAPIGCTCVCVALSLSLSFSLSLARALPSFL